MATATAARTKAAGLEHLKVEHRDGCPKSRLETYITDRPVSKQYPLGGEVLTTRCVDCGRDAHRNVETKAPGAQEEQLDD